MSRHDRDPNRGNRRVPISTVSAADLLGLNDEPAPPPSAAVPDPADVEKAARAMCTYGHTKAHHDAAGACVRPSLDARAAAERAYPDPIRAAVRIAFERGWDAALTAVRPSPDSEAEPGAWDHVEWCVFAGGEHPDDAATVLTYDDEGEAYDMAQWITGGGIASRVVRPGPWTIARAALGTGDREGADRG